MTRIVGKQSRFQWWLLWLAAAGLAAAISPLGAQEGTGCRFSDVPQSSPQQADIVYACQQEWFEGYPDGTFRPDREVPQHQIAAVINRAFPTGSTRADLASFLRGGNPGDPDGSADFDDVAESHPQNRDIAYAVQQGWFQGYPDGAFRPDRTITSNQIATVVSRAFPAGSTRADLAVFMRQGVQALNALTPPTTSSPRKIAYPVPKYDSFGDQVALELWVSGVDGSGARRLTDDARLINGNPIWGWVPGGERIFYEVAVRDFRGNVVEATELWVEDEDGSDAHRITDNINGFNWSLDGERIAYRLAVRDSFGSEISNELWVTEVDRSSSRRLTDKYPWDFQWSPDGERVAYTVSHGYKIELWVAEKNGSATRRLVDNVDPYGWWWSPDGERIAYKAQRELWVVGADGSDARMLAHDFETSDWPPDRAWSPDGERIAYTVVVRDSSGSRVAEVLWVVGADGSGARQLTDDFAYFWEWSPDGKYIAYESRTWEYGKWLGTGLWVAGADGSGARRLTSDVAESWKWRWSSDGERIAYEVKVRDSSRVVIGTELWVAGVDGSGPRQLSDDVDSWEWSPDGEQIAYESTTLGYLSKLWVVAVDGSELRQLTDSVFLSNWEWSPEGAQIAYRVYVVDSSERIADIDLWVVSTIGSGVLRLNSNDIWSWGWSSNGEWLSYTTWDEILDDNPLLPGTLAKLKLWVVGVDGSRARQITSNIAYDVEGEKVHEYWWQPVDR